MVFCLMSHVLAIIMTISCALSQSVDKIADTSDKARSDHQGKGD